MRAPLQQRRADSAPHPGTGWLGGPEVFLWRQTGDARRLQEEVAVPGPGACHLTAGGGRSRGSPGLGGPCGSVWGWLGSGEGAAGARSLGGEEGRRAGTRRRGGGRGASAPGGPAGLNRRRAGPAGTRAAAGGAGGASVCPGPAPPGRACRPGGRHLPAGRLGDGGGLSRLRVGRRLGGSSTRRCGEQQCACARARGGDCWGGANAQSRPLGGQLRRAERSRTPRHGSTP